MSENVEYRLTFESISPFQADEMEQRHGKGVWPRLAEHAWDALSWRKPTVKITTDPWDQYRTLKRWADTHEQPIRNVILEQRPAPLPDEGWTPAIDAEVSTDAD